ncbi:MazG nucleotide pyrophosphohydrolase domain-containing protein [Kiloniella laminariae]|uniref:MazG nucleotide pyrophosphohydrolase domain-containing protein n=1 Tax=Kiloniella laminariae TaxID=454162 RepID=UPI00035F44F4|nr:MazG nucleotide pyrophosphohydrolase domain-containing protein [Kiloniella laminariae]
METQKSICLWAEETFGPVDDPVKLVTRAMQEMTELLEAVKTGDKSEIGKETADVVILLKRLLAQYDLTFSEEINRKMATNRARKWRAAGDGTGKHIPDI